MPRLNDQQLASLLEEIGASMKLDIPIADAMRRLGSRRLGRVSKASQSIAESIEAGQSASQAVKLSSAAEYEQVSAVVAAAEKTGDSGLLISVAKLLRRRHNFSRMTRLTWLYPLLLIAVAYFVGAFVMAPVVLVNHGNGVEWPGWVYQMCQFCLAYWWVLPLIGLIVVSVVLVWGLSRRKPSRPAALNLLCESIADQIEHGVPDTDAIRLASQIAGLEREVDQEASTIDSPYIRRLLDEAGNPIKGLDVNQQPGIVARLRFAAALYRNQSRRLEYIWGRLAPRVALVIVGAGFTLAYAWWIIRPVYQQVAQW